MTLYISGSEILSWRKEQLFTGGRVEDLDWLLDMIGGIGWSELQKIYLEPSKNLTLKTSLQNIEAFWVLHLKKQIPLQYLIGRCPWRDFELEINSSALIPRQETELLVDCALEKIDSSKIYKGIWADLGTGCGPLAVALARGLPSWEGQIVDCSEEAISLARKNLNRLAPDASFRLHVGNWWDPLKPSWGKFSLVVSNPPYIPSSLIKDLEPVVRDYEPHLALCGGCDGLAHIRSIIQGAVFALQNGGWLLMEHHYDQSDDVLNLMKKNGLVELSYELDLNGVKRFAVGRKISKIF